MKKAIISDIKINPEYEKLVPRPTDDEYESLKRDIEKNGITYPLIVNPEYIIIDGHTRYKIAVELKKIEVPIRVKDYKDKLREARAVITLNVKRREHNIAQKAEMGLKLLSIEKKLAKKRQTLGKPLPKGKKGKARDKAAKAVGISGVTLDKARKIIEAAEDNEEIAKLWKEALKGKVKLESVYKKVQESEQVDKKPVDIHDIRVSISVDKYVKENLDFIIEHILDKNAEKTHNRAIQYALREADLWQKHSDLLEA